IPLIVLLIGFTTLNAAEQSTRRVDGQSTNTVCRAGQADLDDLEASKNVLLGVSIVHNWRLYVGAYVGYFVAAHVAALAEDLGIFQSWTPPEGFTFPRLFYLKSPPLKENDKH